MAGKNLVQKSMHNIINTIPYLMQFPAKRFWIDYDDAVDVLYISLDRPQNATESEMLKEGIIVRYRGKKIVGITVLDASKRRKVH